MLLYLVQLVLPLKLQPKLQLDPLVLEKLLLSLFLHLLPCLVGKGLLMSYMSLDQI